jgi:hypothetical protein
MAGDYPFQSTAAFWECGDGNSFAGFTSAGGTSIACTRFEQDSAPCVRGTFAEAGFAAEGACAAACPVDRPTTNAPGATSEDDCVPLPEDCAEITVQGDNTGGGWNGEGTNSESGCLGLSGVYVKVEGECGTTTGGRQAWQTTNEIGVL